MVQPISSIAQPISIYQRSSSDDDPECGVSFTRLSCANRLKLTLLKQKIGMNKVVILLESVGKIHPTSLLLHDFTLYFLSLLCIGAYLQSKNYYIYT